MEEDKASRILDAAEALLVSYGYRKVTIDEVARRAGVGKGTVYLYWPSKRELFATVLTRESAELVREQLAALREDPAEVRLHRVMRRTFVQVMKRPLARAQSIGDYDVLGELLTMSKAGLRLAASKSENTSGYLVLLHKHGLLADDPATDPLLSYRLSAAVTGAFLLESVLGAADFDLDDKAEALATTVRRAFEPSTEPTPATLRDAATELADLHERWLAVLDNSFPQGNS
ncbi:TetR family transcriptional regulator [Actinopolymorpha pittospori]|uniref:AcrR family transcriptional regulator n=1 Tax=Actinopolymorpha pittospori TaxID=648752 RepID=A0A927N510_9ACTN|nr:AcrR family transcriptional regulator [Actinopolymorpha pittospori]